MLCMQVACAAAVIAVTALKLHNFKVTWDDNTWSADVHNTCLLGTMRNGANLCYLAYMAGGTSMLATGALSLLQCCTCRLCGLGSVLDVAFAAAGSFLWAIAGIIFDGYNKQPSMATVPQPEWRFSITILSFTACAVFGLMALLSLYRMLSACCCAASTCCSPGGGPPIRTKTMHLDYQQALDVENGRHSQFIAR